MKRATIKVPHRSLPGWGILLFFSCLTTAALPSLAQPQPQPKPAPKPVAPEKPAQSKTPGACASVSGSVRAEAFGYTHIVSLRNACDKPVECDVWTDVDPTPRHLLRAAAGENVDIVTRIGAPSREVVAHKECRFGR